MIIWISGPTGSGKTTVTRSLRASGYSVVEENVPEKLFKAFASDPRANCEDLQRQIMQARFDRWREVSDTSRIAFDRSIEEDIQVFCKMHWQAGHLTQDQFNILAEFGRGLQEQIPHPDLIFFLRSQEEVLLKRMKTRAYPALILDRLKDQVTLYAEWLQTKSGEIMDVDTSRLSEQSLARFFREIRSC